jgi:hypothetical protein
MRPSHCLFALVAASFCLLIVALVGHYFEAEERAFRLTAVSGEAVVIGHSDSVSRSNGKRSTTHWEHFEFVTAARRVVQFDSVITGLRPRHQVGERLKILYQPLDPTKARLDDDSATTVATLLYWVASIGFVAVTVVGVRYVRGRRARRAIIA